MTENVQGRPFLPGYMLEYTQPAQLQLGDKHLTTPFTYVQGDS